MGTVPSLLLLLLATIVVVAAVAALPMLPARRLARRHPEVAVLLFLRLDWRHQQQLGSGGGAGEKKEKAEKGKVQKGGKGVRTAAVVSVAAVALAGMRRLLLGRQQRTELLQNTSTTEHQEHRTTATGVAARCLRWLEAGSGLRMKPRPWPA